MAANTARQRKTRAGPGRPGRLSAAEAARIPDRLMDAAMSLFLERGYGETTMDEIARRAGASTKTLYSRYPGKPEILQAVVRRVMDRMMSRQDDFAVPEALADDPRAFLESLCSQISTRIATEGAHLNRLAHTEAQRFPEFKRMHDMMTAHDTAAIAAALARWRGAGLMPDLPDLSRSAAHCLSSATDWARIRTSLGDPPGRAEIEAHVAFAVDFFLRGCGYREAAPVRRARAGK